MLVCLESFTCREAQLCSLKCSELKATFQVSELAGPRN